MQYVRANDNEPRDPSGDAAAFAAQLVEEFGLSTAIHVCRFNGWSDALRALSSGAAERFTPPGKRSA